jgi:antitoxin component YwqK of YwqJK toxin-antitoxin module
MSPKEALGKIQTVRHRDGSLWARGRMKAGKPDGFWKWFRKDGTVMRSGYFGSGQPVGKWTTFDAKGKVVKVTVKKEK